MVPPESTFSVAYLLKVFKWKPPTIIIAYKFITEFCFFKGL